MKQLVIVDRQVIDDVSGDFVAEMEIKASQVAVPSQQCRYIWSVEEGNEAALSINVHP